MDSFDQYDRFDPDAPPPRPTTPPVRRGFIFALLVLSLAATLVYGIPYMAERAGYSWEAGRSRASIEALAKLDKAGVIDRSSALFRMATSAAAPAVVNIRNWRAGRLPQGIMPPAGGAGRFERGLLPVGSGSGVVIDKANGFIVTNNHVVKDADEIVVRLGRGGEWPARLVGADPKTDLAVLQIRANLEVEAQWGDSDKLDIGDWVLAIGSPFELDRTVTAGIVSATGRSNLRIIGEGSYEDFIQTDAAVNPGNSGGPLIDLRGRVIGINTAIFSPGAGHNEGQGNVGIGFAIPSSLARKIADGLIRDGRVIRGYLGVTLRDLDGAEAEAAKVPDGRGAMVDGLDPDGPAARAGVRPGDVIVKLGATETPDRDAVKRHTAGLKIGSESSVLVYRDGKPLNLAVRIAELPRLAALGLHIRDLPERAARSLPHAPDRAVVIDQVFPGTAAAAIGLRPGLVLVSVAQRPAPTKADCDAAANAADPNAPLPMEVMTPDGQSIPLLLGAPIRPKRS